MTALNASNLLDLWEAGMRRHPIDRALAMVSMAGAVGSLAEMPLGQRNWHLMRLRQTRFGDHLSVWLDCPDCGERMTMKFSVADLPEVGPGHARVEVEGHAFRLPNSRDLADLVSAEDASAAARALFFACAEAPEALPQGAALESLVQKVGSAMDAADPWADLCFEAKCPACKATQEMSLDIGDLLWQELESAALRLLDEIHSLARAYGWSEREILSLTDYRRAAYLTRVGI